MRKKPLLAVALCAAVGALGLIAPRAADATLVLALDTPAMLKQADHVAVVDVGSVTAAWDEGHERILTTIDLTVVESWKGPMAPAMHIKVVQPGGSVGDMSMVVFGMTRFSPGERALVFLRGAPTSANVVGMSQGKRLVRRDAATGRWMVHVPEAAGASFVRPRPTTTPPATTPAAPSVTAPIFETRLRPLDDLRVEIRDILGKANGR
jgi:hypothetical protein